MAAGGRMLISERSPGRGIFELGFESRRGVHQAEKVEVRGGKFHILSVPVKLIAKVFSEF